MPAPTISNAVDGLENGEDIEKLKKLLPHVNLETGLKHRSVTRDPITGLGAKSVDEVEGRIRSRSHSATGRAYNHTLISWNIDSDAAATKLAQCKRKNARNPITMTGDLGDEVDKFRSTNRPRGATLREPQRNPISGQGNFGEREWDPVWKYNGKIRRSKSSTNIRSNPLTGQNVKSFEVMFEEKPRASKRHEEKNKPQRNALTGANCTSYSVPPGMKEAHTSQHSPIQRNAITGEHCSTYDINAEVRCQKKRPNSNCTNPISGENMRTFVMSQEERQRPNKPYVYKNTVTGENLTSYQITPIERHVKSRQSTERQNPLIGENMKTYKYRPGESNLTMIKRDLSSPLTGEGARGRTYTISIEERPRSGQDNQTDRTRARSYGPSRNVLTGENCETYYVCREMRSETVKPLLNGSQVKGRVASYNIITGT